MKNHLNHLALAALTLFLYACGGGGGSSSAPDLPGSDSGAVTPPAAGASATYSVSGTVTASLLAFDGDSADPNAPRQPNDTLEAAQPLGAALLVAGHAAVEGDEFDVYRLDLQAGQSVRLQVADSEGADLDLFLGGLGGELLAASQDVGSVEAVRAEASGSYYLTVQAVAGASGYLLTVVEGEEDLPTLGITQEFVPGEIVAEHRESSGASTMALAGDLPAAGLERKAGAPGRAILYGLAPQASLLAAETVPAHPLVDLTQPSVREKMETIRIIKALRRDPRVRFAEPNYLLQAQFVPNDRHYPLQWHYPLINLPQAWDLTRGDPAVVVAVVDTGILAGHPDLAGSLVAGYDFIADPVRAGDGNGIDPDPTDNGDLTSPDGSHSFHGTHVAGTVAAATDNGSGVAGVAGGAKVMPLRALGHEQGSSYDIAQAILYASGLPNDSGTVPERPASVINLSLGGPYASTLQRDACARARQAGVILVAAAGNDGTTQPLYPAAFREVLSVSAVTLEKRLAGYSNSGSTIDIAAPGGEMARDVNRDGFGDGVLSTLWDGEGYTYSFLSGTSMAAPHLAGVAALMRSVHPGLTPADLDLLLASGAMTEDLGVPGRDDSFGFGLVDAFKAVTAARQLAGESLATPALVAEPTTFTFSPAQVSAFLQLTGTGGESLQVTAVSASVSWLRVLPASIDPATALGTYTVVVDRTKMATGTHAAAIQVTSTSGNLEIPVTAEKSAANADSAGYVYVIATDGEGRSVAQTQGLLQAGGLAFRLPGMAAGPYLLFAGTDLNNDGTICDPGEACGAWSGLQAPQPLDVTGDRDRIDLELEGAPAAGAGLVPIERLR